MSQHDMRGFLRCHELDALISQRPQINPLEQPFSPAEQDGGDGDMKLINEAGTKILLDGVRPAADAHVLSIRRRARPFKRLMNAARDEVECRPAFQSLENGTPGLPILGT